MLARAKSTCVCEPNVLFADCEMFVTQEENVVVMLRPRDERDLSLLDVRCKDGSRLLVLVFSLWIVVVQEKVVHTCHAIGQGQDKTRQDKARQDKTRLD